MSRNPTHRLAAWFQIVIGIAVIGWWAIAAATNGIVELEEGRIDIVFHIAAELLMAWLLISAGSSVLRRGATPTTMMLSGLALGALVYSSVNSPGYFAERGAWSAVGMFLLLGASATAAAMTLALRNETRHRPDHDRRRGVRSDTMNQRRDTSDTGRLIGSAR